MREQVYLSKLTKRFRITLEESWAYEKPEARNLDRRWFEIIPCKGFKKPPMQEGPFIALYSEDPATLMLYTDRVQNAKKIWNTIKDCPGTRADFLGGEVDLFFPPDILETVAEMAGARKKRQLSEDHRARLIEAGKVGREALQRWQKERAQAKNLGQIEAIPTQVGS